MLREQVVSRRERDAQEALHRQRRTDERAIFQRDTILAAQDTMAEFVQLIGRRVGEGWSSRRLGGDLAADKLFWKPPASSMMNYEV